LAILYTVCRFTVSAVFAEGVFFGYLIGVYNFRTLSKKIRVMLEEEGSSFSAVTAQFRLLITAAVLVILIKYLNINVFGILVGLSIIPLSIPIYVIYKNIDGEG